MNQKAVVCFSGGADSTTLLYHALRECQEVHTISVYYGQRHGKREIDAASKTIKYLREYKEIPHEIIEMGIGVLGGSPLTDSSIAVPNQDEKKQGITVVPFRNTLLITLAAAYARVKGLNTIYVGPTYEDLAEYPDCRPVFYEALQHVLRLGDKIHDLVIKTPFITSTKNIVVKYGITLGVDYSKTSTCYVGEETPCLKCDACRERMESFRLNDMRDPLVSEENWAAYLIEKNT